MRILILRRVFCGIFIKELYKIRDIYKIRNEKREFRRRGRENIKIRITLQQAQSIGRRVDGESLFGEVPPRPVVVCHEED